MTATINTPDILIDRTGGSAGLSRSALPLRDVAQLAPGLSAGFSEILRTQLDAARPVEPAREPAATESSQTEPESPAATEADAEGAGDSEKSADETKAQSETSASTDRDESETAEASTETVGDGAISADSGAEATPEDNVAAETLASKAADEAQAERRFISEHGTRAAKLRWDSIGVELTHAADVNIAERNAQKLASRAGHADGLARPHAERAEASPSTIAPKTQAETTPNKAPIAHPGSPVRDSADSGVRAQPEPTAAKPVETNTPTGTTPTKSPDAVVASRDVAPVIATQAGAERTGASVSRASTGRTDLMARLGSLNAAAPTSVTSKETVNAIDGITRSMLKTDRADRAQAAAPAPKNDKSETIRQVQQGLARLIKSSGGESTVRLNPKSLGEVTVRLDLREGVASARFTASNDVARGLLQSGLKDLHAALETRGLRVERLTVDSDTSKQPTESARHEARAEPQANRAGDGSPATNTPAGWDRPEADGQGRGGHPGDTGHHGQGRPGDAQAEASTRSVGAEGTEPLFFDEPAGLEERWIRLDTVA